MWPFAWRASVMAVVLIAAAVAIDAVTQDEGVRLLIGVAVTAVIAGALWPVELGLKAGPPRRSDHTSHH